MIGYWVIGYDAILKVLEVNYGINDSLKVQYNNEKPLHAILLWDEEAKPFIEVFEERFYLDDCLRVH